MSCSELQRVLLLLNHTITWTIRVWGKLWPFFCQEVKKSATDCPEFLNHDPSREIYVRMKIVASSGSHWELQQFPTSQWDF